jgi:uncharacterized protein
MPSDVVGDTGFFYALFDGNDALHPRAVEVASTARFAYLSTMPVITETAYLLQSLRLEAVLDFLGWVRKGAVQLVELSHDDLDRIMQILKKYKDLPADFADASIVAVAECLKVNRIATFDSDFVVYRYLNRSRFRNVLS